jgi:nucleoside 2-deoxyribosyltransferase
LKRLYVASACGFSEAGRVFLREFYQRLRDAGFEVEDPWDGIMGLKQEEVLKGVEKADHDAAMKIGAENRNKMDASDVMIAILDGTDIDSGTASEVGYFFAKGKRVIGYRGDFRAAGDSGGVVNLQVQWFIESSGGKIYRTLGDVIDALR